MKFIKSFNRWIRSQASRQDAVGNFARDAALDADCVDWRHHLFEMDASDACLKAFNAAWNEYER
jgi:hypothetical protein